MPRQGPLRAAGPDRGGRPIDVINTKSIPAFDGEPGTPVPIMVSRVGGGQQSGAQHPPKPDASLTNTYWKLVELNGHPAALGAGGKELSMKLVVEENRVQGFSGCNRFKGAYTLTDNRLQFKQMASTMMACVEGMDQEQQFLEALGSTNRFSIQGENLALYDSEDQLILRFEAVYLK